MARPILLLCLTLASLVVLRTDAAACSCAYDAPPCEAFWNTDAVFDATVDAIKIVTRRETDRQGQPIAVRDRLVRLTVRESWKGVQPGTLEVVTADFTGECGFDFKRGRRYLVFAQKSRLNGRWVVSHCSATREYDGSGDDARFLASLSRPPAGGRIFGSVTSLARAPIGASPRAAALVDTEQTRRAVDATVRLTGGGKERRAISTNGRFEFEDLDVARYRLELQLPEGYSTYRRAYDLEIPHARACQRRDFVLEPSGRIGGYLVTAGGRPAAALQVEATDPTGLVPVVSARTDAAGHFEIHGVVSRAYVIGINSRDPPSTSSPYARTMYPKNGVDGELVEIVPGQTFDLGTWRLPPPLAVVRVEGVATWQDGKPAAGVYVGVWDRTGNPIDQASGAGGATVDADGRFVLELRQGRTYVFMARDTSSALLSVAGPRLGVGTTAPDPVRLVIAINP